MKDIDLSRADLNLLVLFEAVLQEGHVGRAAERLSLSPSAVSHGLGRLRRMLQDPVFLRTPRGVVPTARALELALITANRSCQFIEWVDHGYGIVHVAADRTVAQDLAARFETEWGREVAPLFTELKL